jgi:predicted metal-binding membrane protein
VTATASPANTVALPAPRVARLPKVVPATIALAWAATIAVHATGLAHRVHHDELLGGHHAASDTMAGMPDMPGMVHDHGGHAAHAASFADFALYGAVWTLMITAMMLPTALPLMRLFVQATASATGRRIGLAAFAAGYLAIWSLMGWVALGVDKTVHIVVNDVPWLDERSWLVAAGILALAGAFQFSELKDRCLTECRHPGAFLLRYYRRGSGGAFLLGWRHGVFCVGCCWALMLVMFAAGAAMLWWMVALTAVMAYEKLGRHGARISPDVGVTLLLLAGVVAVRG